MKGKGRAGGQNYIRRDGTTWTFFACALHEGAIGRQRGDCCGNVCLVRVRCFYLHHRHPPCPVLALYRFHQLAQLTTYLLPSANNREMNTFHQLTHPTTYPLPPANNREMNEHNIEIGIIGADRKFRILSPSEVKREGSTRPNYCC